MHIHLENFRLKEVKFYVQTVCPMLRGHGEDISGLEAGRELARGLPFASFSGFPDFA